MTHRRRPARAHFAIAIGIALLSMAPSPAAAKDWNAVRRVDPFTDSHSCRVEPGGRFSRSAVRQLAGSYLSYYFYAERRNAEIRAGVFAEPSLPISGDVQIRVDDHPMITITAADTPIDAAPTVPMAALDALPPDQRAALQAQMRATLAVASPYRALIGERAALLIEEILAGKVTIARTVGINAATSSIAEWRPDKDLRAALLECGILGEDGRVVRAAKPAGEATRQ